MRTTDPEENDQSRDRAKVRTGRTFRLLRGSSAACAARIGWSALALPLFLAAACQSAGQGTLAELRNTQIEIKESKIQDVPDKAIESYRRFLENAPDSALKPQAIRRLADLKVEKESGVLAEDRGQGQTTPAAGPAGQQLTTGEATTHPPAPASAGTPTAEAPAVGAILPEGTDAREAIRLYTKLLNDYPDYDRNDEVLYQMSRAYEQLGQVDDAMQVMDRLVREHPKSRYIDEVQFRRGEYFFTRRRYADAEAAYGSVVVIGQKSTYFSLALYKQGWSRYKQEHYDKALDSFIALLDHKAAAGIDIARPPDGAERKSIEDTFRVISLSFSNLGGPGSVVDYFGRNGGRGYEDSVYRSLGEFYFEKNRYGDAAAAYNAFIEHHPFHAKSPQFQMRVIEIDLAGGFPSLVIDAKKEFARRYGVTADYWKHFEPAARPEVLAWLKTNLTDLAKHYHALYQSPKESKDKEANFGEAEHWYKEFLASFPQDKDAPAMNYLLADLYLENRNFDRAAIEYEKTAYGYPPHARSAEAGYAAVYAWRQLLAGAGPAERDKIRRKAVDSSIKFAYTYPEHPKAAIVLGAAADDLYDMKDYEMAAAAAHSLIERFPKADPDVLCQAWLVDGHASYELRDYPEAERAYAKLLVLLPPQDKRREGLIDNLAAAIYKQGEEARARGNYLQAASHFLRVGTAAPGSKIRANAEYDGAAALIQVKDWMMAVTVLKRFRDLFPGHQLQPEVTKKLAYVYREMGEYGPAADEYERVERESTDENVQREALLSAADMHKKAGHENRMLAAYQRYVDLFPHPAEPNLELRDRIAEVLKKRKDQAGYQTELQQIVAIDAAAGNERTPRTRALAAKAALALAQQAFDSFAAVKLVEPFQANLDKKKELMKAATQQFNGLVDYEIGDITAAATYYLAEIYEDFSKDLKESQRPAGLNDMEREEYELAIEDQAYPFEEKAIATHQSNLELISRGVYDEWIEKSLRRLAELVPARYDKPEVESPVVTSPDRFVYALGGALPPASSREAGARKQDAKGAGSAEAAKAGVAQPGQKAPGPQEATKAGEQKRDAKPADAPDAMKTVAPKQTEKPDEVPQVKQAETPGQAGGPEAADKKQAAPGPSTGTAGPGDKGAVSGETGTR